MARLHALVPFVSAVALTFAALGVSGCGNNEEPYKATPAFSGRKASLPAVPQLPTTPMKSGDSYTVYGAIHQLRSIVHNKDVTARDISIEGYIVDTNVARAPDCAVHKTGKKDPDGCVSEIPQFTLSDQKNVNPDPTKPLADSTEPRIKVMGWASNFANVFDAIQKYKNLKDPPKELVKDELWGVDIPFPLPAIGAKVRVTGKYGFNFAKSSAGIAADPLNGIMTYTKIDVLEPAPEPAAFAKK